MNEKFNGCFIDDGSLYTYDVYYDGELIAKAKTLSAKDRSTIERAAMEKRLVDGQLELDIDTHALKTYTILAAITSWELGRKLDADSVAMLTEKIRDHLYTAIQDHENTIAGLVEDTEKN